MDPLSVPMKYKYNTRIGNWNEEQQLEEHKFNEFIKNAWLFKKKRGKCTWIFKNWKKISGSNDGYLHYNSIIMLQNHKTKGYLCNINNFN